MESFITYKLKNGKSGNIEKISSFKLRKIININNGAFEVKNNVQCLELNQDSNSINKLKFFLNSDTILNISAFDQFEGVIEVVGGKVDFSLTDSLDSDDKIVCSGMGGSYRFSDEGIQINDAQSVKINGGISTKVPTISIVADDILFSQSHISSKNVFLSGKCIKFVDTCFKTFNSFVIRTEDLVFNSSVIESDDMFKIQSASTYLDSEAIIVNKGGSIEYNDFRFINEKYCYLDGASFNRRFAGGNFVSLLKAVSNRLNSSNEELISSLRSDADNDIQRLNDTLKEKELSIARQLEDERSKIVRRANDNYNAVKQSFNLGVNKVNQDMEVKKEAVAKRKVKSIFNKTS